MTPFKREDLTKHPPVLRREDVTVQWTDDSGEVQARTVTVTELTVAERNRFEDSFSEGASFADEARQRLVIATAKCDSGPLFTDADFDLISGLGAGFVEPIVNAAMRLNKIGQKDLEDLGKNSQPTNDDVSS